MRITLLITYIIGFVIAGFGWYVTASGRDPGSAYIGITIFTVGVVISFIAGIVGILR